MDEMINFKCIINEEDGLNKEEANALGISYPEVHYNKEMLIKAAKAIKDNTGTSFCELPFCHTLEAENIGANINFGNDITGPRAGEYNMKSFTELVDFPAFNFSKGRMKLVLEATKELSAENEVILFNISGPLTIFNMLVDPKYIFKALRKEPEEAWKIFDKLQKDMLEFLKVIKENGVNLVSFADSVAGVDILGPKLMVEYLDRFVIPFTQKALDICGNEMVLILCPKLTYSLTSANKAYFKDIQLPEKSTYGQAITSLIGNNVIVGEMCIQNKNIIMNNDKIKILVLS